jgi:dipeptidyl aminopeptidase/acylaminoacyl peptidase
VFKTAVEGRFPLYRVDMGIGKVERLALPSVRAFDIAMGEEGDAKGKIAFSFSRISMPRELYVSQPDGSRPIRVTRLNQQIQETHDIRPAEEMWVEGADGKKVHVFLVKPHGFTPSKRYPLIVNIHGGPQYQWADSFRGDWQVYPGAGYVVAFPNPHGSIGYGQSYTRAISGDWGGKVYEDIMKVTDELAKLPYVDENRIGAMGWSYGGYMINWILGHTQRFKALASMMGVYDLRSFYGATEELWFPEFDMPKPPWENPEAYRKWSPSTYADEFRTPTLVITGEKDYRVPYTQSLQLFTALRRQGVDARLIVFPDDGHWPSWVKSMPLYYTAHLDWFHKYLGGEAPPRKVREMVRGETPGKKKE